MKDKIKAILPEKVTQSIQSFLRVKTKIRKSIKNTAKRKTPLLTKYLGDDPSVLQCCIAYNKFGGYCVPLSSYLRPTAQKILSGEIHEQETVEYIVNNCKEGDIVHAGAYFGDALPVFSQACSESNKVWAFEPHPENYRCASITALINDLKNVELIQGGLGAEKNELRLVVENINRASLGGGSYIVKGREEFKSHQKTVLVQIYKLDDLIPLDRKISVLHLDVEGYETLALEGAIAHISQSKPILILETFPEEEWLKKHLLPLGYKYVGGVSRNTSSLKNYIFSIA